ncbi:hypothetical protein F2Q69_00000201 [Brassica cretica]|uniref:Pectinesterase n=1 Tax=Brassica cretica TaxID=69181 RepID=A0A8S9P4Z4_BRACR|nr:hypothetical protein F2Q69_00000201 [Brassica cretica]
MASYGKLDEHEQAKLEASRRTKKRIAIIAISSIVLVCIVVGAVVGTAANSNGKKPSSTGNGNGDSISVSVKAVCDVTLHKDKCLETVGSAPNASTLNPEELFNYAVQITLTELTKVLNGFSDNKHMDSAMGACVELIELAVDQLNDTMTSLKDHTTSSPKSTVADLRTWLSSVETYQETCMEALIEANNPNTTSFGETHLKNSTEMTSNALAIITWLGKIADSIKLNHRRLLATAEADLPMMSARGLLESSDLRKIANIVVAQDGSGKYRTISEALVEVEEKNEKRTIIYVKKGVYVENVRVEKKKWNVVMVGDGQSKTIVSGGLNFIDGTPTFQTATFGKYCPCVCVNLHLQVSFYFG